MANDYIGSLVKKFESGNYGSLALEGCGNDWGLSCGSYQLTLRWGNCINFLKKYFPTEAKKLYFNNQKKDIATAKYPGPNYSSSPTEVKTVWKACYKKVGADKFFEYEHDWICSQYYEPLLKKLSGKFNPNTHSRMAQECLWSWAVHKGVNGAYKYFNTACEGIDPQSTLAIDLIDKLYDMRYSVNKFNRYKKGISISSSERETLRSYCNVYPLKYSGTSASDGTKATGIQTNPYKEPSVYIKKGSTGEGVKWLQWELRRCGYKTVKYVNEQGATVSKTLSIDGDFGMLTYIAVRQFQKSKGLEDDGIVGTETKKALKAYK